jgi:hypothetical protein
MGMLALKSSQDPSLTRPFKDVLIKEMSFITTQL